MTKRMLSLLLALVMTLSLCVPALAADEFAAEPVAEVEEQAPEAPEAPVEPEAEVEEEPVVDEPAMEEADAPEIAAVIAEDEPEVIGLAPETAAEIETCSQLAEYLAVQSDGAVVKLSDEISGNTITDDTTNAVIEVPASVTIDLNGNTIATTGGFKVAAGKTLTIQDSSLKAIASDGVAKVDLSAEGAKLVVKSGTVKAVTLGSSTTKNAALEVSGDYSTVSGITQVANTTATISGGTVTFESVAGDVTMTDGTVVEFKSITAGKINVTGGTVTKIKAVTTGEAEITLGGDAKITEVGTITAVKTLTITGEAEVGSSSHPNVEITEGGLVMDGGTVNGHVKISKGTFAISGGEIDNGTTAAALDIDDGTSKGVSGTITGGTFKGKDATSGGAIKVTTMGTFVKGGVFIPSLATKVDSAVETVSDAVKALLVDKETADVAVYYAAGESDKTSATAIGKDSIQALIDAEDDGTVSVIRATDLKLTGNDGVTVKNGTGKDDTVSVDGTALKNGGETKALVAQVVGGKTYDTLKEAVEEAVKGGFSTVKLLADHTVVAGADVDITASLTLDLNKHTLTTGGTNQINITGTSATASKPVNVVIMNGTIKGSTSGIELGTGTKGANVKLTLNDVYAPTCDITTDSTGGCSLVIDANTRIGAVTNTAGATAKASVEIAGAANGAVTLTVPKGTVTLTGTFNNNVTVTAEDGTVNFTGKVVGASHPLVVNGDDVTLNMSGAKTTLDGALTLGTSTTATIHGSISDITAGNLTLNGKTDSDLTITSGLFGTVAGDAGSWTTKPITGGIFSGSTTIGNLTGMVNDVGVVKLEASKKDADDTDWTNPLGTNEGKYFVGGDIDTNLAKIDADSKCTITAQNAVTLTTLPDDEDITVTHATSVSFTYGAVILDNTGGGSVDTPTADKVVKLNNLIAKAMSTLAGGTLSAEDQAALRVALSTAMAAHSSTATVAASITALEGLLPKDAVDKSALSAEIAAAEALKQANYTEESWKDADLANVIEAAKAVYNNALATKTQVDEAVANLQAAVAKLKTKADKTTLDAAIKAAEALKQADYTAASWTPFATALATAKEVAANANATAAQIQTAQDNLLAAQAALVKTTPASDIPPAPKSGTGWMQSETTGDIYFYKDGVLKKGFWVGKTDGASKWDNTWYYVGADGKLATGFQYIDDLHGGYGWYMLQTTNDKGQIGKMLTGYQWTYTAQGEGYFSAKSGESGKCTWNEGWGAYNASTKLWADGLAHAGA